MVGFEAKLLRERRADWAEHYVDYALLKRQLKRVREAKDSSQLQALLEARKAVFQATLDEQILQVLHFYNAKAEELQRELECTLADLLTRRSISSAAVPGRWPGRQPDQQGGQALNGAPPLNGGDNGGGNGGSNGSGRGGDRPGSPGRWSEEEVERRVAAVDEGLTQLQRLAGELSDLLAFISLNMVAIRKIVKKLSKHTQPLPPQQGRLVLQIDKPGEDWHVHIGSFLAPHIAQQLAEMQEHRALVGAGESIRERVAVLQHLREQLLGSRQLRRHNTLRQRLVDAEPQVSGVLADIQQMHEQACHDASFVKVQGWTAALAGMVEEPPPDEAAIATPMGLALQCSTALLWMANYSLVVPLLRPLCRRVGAPDSRGGIIVGVADVASLVSTIGYSHWTATSFRQPLLASAALCLAGNALCIVAWGAQSLPLLLLGRLVLGFGSARAVSRRYMADFVSKANRTRASIAFVASSTLGAALGPFAARVPWPSALGRLPLHPATAEMATMAVLWLAFAAAVAAFFQEPRLRVRLESAGSKAAEEVEALRAAASGDLKVYARNGGNGALQQPLLCDAPTGGSSGQACEPRRGGAAPAPAAAPLQPQQAPVRRRLPRGALAAPAACLVGLVLQRVVQQGWVDEVPLVTGPVYGWSDATAGMFLGLVGCMSLPVHFTAGWVSKYVEDRQLLLGALAACAAGLVVLLQSGPGGVAYLAGGVTLFLGTTVWEGACMALLSKVLPRGLASGFWNGGLLSTEAGTTGRFGGNLLLWAAGWFGGTETEAEIGRSARYLHSSMMAIIVKFVLVLLVHYWRLKE